MKQKQVLILEYSDLIERYKNLSLEEIDIPHLKINLELICEADMVIFIDKNGKSKIMKNKYGHNGILYSKEEINKLTSEAEHSILDKVIETVKNIE